MTKEEIITGLRNALSRGEPLQKAMQSYVNAGYPIDQVQAASREVHQGVTGQFQGRPGMPRGMSKKSTSTPQETIVKEKKKKPWLLIILGIVVLFLIIILGVFFFFGEPMLRALGF